MHEKKKYLIYFKLNMSLYKIKTKPAQGNSKKRGLYPYFKN